MDLPRKNNGRLPRPAFADCLCVCGVALTGQESDAIFGHFGQMGQINYMDFVREIRGCLHRIRRQLVAQV